MPSGIMNGPSSNREVVILRFHGFGGRQKHASARSGAASFFDQDERPRQTVRRVTVKNEPLRRFQADLANVVQRKFRRVRLGLEGGDVDAILDVRNDSLDGLGGMFEEIFFSGLKRALMHPANPGAQVAVGTRQEF